MFDCFLFSYQADVFKEISASVSFIHDDNHPTLLTNSSQTVVMLCGASFFLLQHNWYVSVKVMRSEQPPEVKQDILAQIWGRLQKHLLLQGGFQSLQHSEIGFWSDLIPELTKLSNLLGLSKWPRIHWSPLTEQHRLWERVPEGQMSLQQNLAKKKAQKTFPLYRLASLIHLSDWQS